MKIRIATFLCAFLSLAVHGMQPQQKFYVTSSDDVTFEIPQEVIPYFETFAQMQTGSGMEPFKFDNYSSKILQFLVQLAQVVHQGGSIQNLIGSFLLFNERNIAELEGVLQYLDPVESIKKAFASLIEERRRVTQQANAPAGPEGTITIKVGTRTFSCNKSLIRYMRTLQDFIEVSGQELKSVLQLPSNSILASTDPAIFNTLIEMLKRYNATAREHEGSFDFQPLFINFIQEKELSAQTLVKLVELINYLGVEVLYTPLLQAIASMIRHEKIKSTELSKIEFGDESNHYIKADLIKPLMYEFQLIAMRKARPKVVLNVPGIAVSFSQNGLYACSYEDKRFRFVDFEKKQIVFAYDVPFSIKDCVLSSDGTLIVLWGTEENSDQVYLFDVDTKALNQVIKFPSPVTIKRCALSPEKTKLCVITSQNRVLMLTGKNFASTVADFNFADAGQHNCLYKIHWFSSSLKCMVNIADGTRQKNSVYIVGATVGTYNTHHLMASGAIDSIIAIPLHDNKALTISNDVFPSIVTFTSETHIIPSNRAKLQYRQAEGDLHDAVLSSTGNYVLIFSEGYVDIMEVATGVFIKDFGDIFPAHFNKDDTGLWAYNPGTQYFEFYQYRNAATLFLENILFKLNLQQLQMVISICSAMKNKVHAFKGFEEQWKKIVVAGGHISEKEMKYIERLLYMLQATYDKMYGNFPEESSAEESSETSSSSSSDDDMDVDTEDSQEEQPQEETAIIDTLPMDVDHESNVFPELEKAFQRPNQ